MNYIQKRKKKIKNENKNGEINEGENKEKDKADGSKNRIDKDDIEQEACQLKGNVIGDHNESCLEKEEK